jgi:hypothetical protein
MNKISHKSIAKGAFWIVLAIIAAGLLLMAPKAAVNVDEQLHYPHAKKVVNWYFTGGKDKSCLHTPQTNLKYYGQSADNLTALFNRIFRMENEFLVRHYTGAFFYFMLLLFSGLLTRNISGSWWLATLCILALLFMPRLTGQAFGNLKDIPFATGYLAGLLMIVKFLKEFPSPRWKTTWLLGMAIAFTVSVRAGGLILFAFLGFAATLFFVLKPFYLKQIVSTKPVLVRLLGQGAVILIVGYFAGLLFWPYALQNVFVHPMKSLGVMEHYKVSIRQIFEGEMLWSTQLPWYYLPKWIIISTPLFTLSGFILFICFFLRDIILKKKFTEQTFFEVFILFAFAFPLCYVIAIESNLYSGVRQMLFILPLMALLAVLGAFRFAELVKSRNKFIGYGISGGFLILLIWPFQHQITTFPVDYVYFNWLAGGNDKAWSEYEYDYYFHGLKESAEYLLELVGDEKITVAMNCNLSNYFEHYPNISYQYSRFLERSSYEWDYGLFGINYLHPYLLNNNLWQPEGIVKTFYHKGNPVSILVKRTDKSDFYGISEIKNGNLTDGISLLEMAAEKDANNIWLVANVAKAKLTAGDIAGFEFWLEKGREIFPYYEPFYLLEANRLFGEGKYGETMEKLNQLFKINSRYQPAEKLFMDVKEKLNKTNS